MVLDEDEELDCEVHANGVRMEYVSKFKYFGCVLGESHIDEV